MPTIAEFVSGLREMADWYEANPEIPRPTEFKVYDFGLKKDLDKAKKVAKACGTFEKYATEGLFTIKKHFGSLTLSFVFLRENVCHKRIIGTKTEVEKLPDPFEVAKLPTIERETTREIIEWDCPPLLDREEAST